MELLTVHATQWIAHNYPRVCTPLAEYCTAAGASIDGTNAFSDRTIPSQAVVFGELDHFLSTVRVHSYVGYIFDRALTSTAYSQLESTERRLFVIGKGSTNGAGREPLALHLASSTSTRILVSPMTYKDRIFRERGERERERETSDLIAVL